MMNKYANNESAVDSFVSLLLSELGFNHGWLYIFPQLYLPLTFSNTIEREAIPDFTILDVVSFLRMSVIEDKSVDNVLVNSEPQMIAEAIAAYQQNAKIKYDEHHLHNHDLKSRKRKQETDGVKPKKIKSNKNDDDNDKHSANENDDNDINDIDDNRQVISVRISGTTFRFYSVIISDSIIESMKTRMEGNLNLLSFIFFD